MKFLIAMSVLAFSSITLACTDFSGTYQSQDQEMQVVQSGCESLVLVTPDASLTIIADGNFHQTLTQDIVVHGETLGKMVLFHKAQFESAQVAIDTRIHFEMNGTVEDQEVKTMNSLNAAGDLVSVSTYADGHSETTTAKRIK